VLTNGRSIFQAREQEVRDAMAQVGAAELFWPSERFAEAFINEPAEQQNTPAMTSARIHRSVVRELRE
jgi:hypothetical protein